MISPEMWETKVYKTYLSYAIGVTPPQKAQKFKKPTSPKLSTVPASPEEPTRKSIRVKRPAKKSSDGPTTGVVIRETLVKSLSKKKEKMTVEKRKGIDLLYEVALTEEAYATKIKSFVTNEGTGVKPGVPDVTEEESTESEAESQGRDEDDRNNDHDSRNSEHETDKNKTGSESNQEENEEDVEDDEEEKNDELVKTPSNSTDDEDETNIDDKTKEYEDEGMDYTTNQFDDDVNVRLNKPVTTNEGFIQKEGTDAEMTNVQQGNENPEITLNQASKFLNFLDIPHTDAKIVSPMDVHVHHEVPSNQTPTLLIVPILVITKSLPIFTTVIPQSLSSLLLYLTTLEKEVAELKRNDPLNTQVTALVDEHLESRLGATRDEFMSYLSASITARITEQVVATLTEFELKKILIDKIDESQSYLTATEHIECYDGLIKSYDPDKSLFSTYDKVYSLKRSRKDNDKDEDPSAGSDRGLKKRKTSKDAEPTKVPKAKESQFGSSKGAKSQSKSSRKSVQSEEPEFEVADSDMP
ncbi:hypothetical protein Tco_1254674 [Tanacetum coccineum]